MKTSSLQTGQVVSVNISNEKGTVKKPVSEIELIETGIKGDAHAGVWHRQVSLLAVESIDRFSAAAGRIFDHGDFAENITTCGIDLLATAVFDRLIIGEVELEITQHGKKCHGDSCAIFTEVGRCVMPHEGIFCRVLQGGTIKAGDSIVHQPHYLDCRVITLSDRAHQGVYEDLSGPRVQKHLEELFTGKRGRPRITTQVMPDDAEALRAALVLARDEGAALVITTGGTGIGPRDITPDVVMSLADKTIPGIMEHIRIKFGTEKPNALWSRSVAAILGKTMVFTLPGSVKAVDEYMGEISKSLEHALYMLYGLDTH